MKERIKVKEETVFRNRLIQMEEKQERLLQNFSIKDKRAQKAKQLRIEKE